MAYSAMESKSLVDKSFLLIQIKGLRILCLFLRRCRLFLSSCLPTVGAGKNHDNKIISVKGKPTKAESISGGADNEIKNKTPATADIAP